jgi:uncharacterized UBP type Zn finger protein
MASWKQIAKDACPHLGPLKKERSSTKTQCDVCALTQDLRLCLTCGHVGCCESRGAHNTEHFKQTGHPLITPHRAGYDWLWCYECTAFLT